MSAPRGGRGGRRSRKHKIAAAQRVLDDALDRSADILSKAMRKERRAEQLLQGLNHRYIFCFTPSVAQGYDNATTFVKIESNLLHQQQGRPIERLDTLHIKNVIDHFVLAHARGRELLERSVRDQLVNLIDAVFDKHVKPRENL